VAVLWDRLVSALNAESSKHKVHSEKEEAFGRPRRRWEGIDRRHEAKDALTDADVSAAGNKLRI
jgi:hypothetical protein